MAKKKVKKNAKIIHIKKRRVRTQVIADLSENHVQRQLLLAGFVAESIRSDYGYDMIVSTFDSTGYFEQGDILIQLKATDRPKQNQVKTHVSFSIDKRDLNVWYDEPFPVILILYDAKKEVAYWIYVQQHLRSIRSFKLSAVGNSYSVSIPKTQIVDSVAFENFRKFKLNTLKEVASVITYS
jgi:hypothetical protein